MINLDFFIKITQRKDGFAEVLKKNSTTDL